MNDLFLLADEREGGNVSIFQKSRGKECGLQVDRFQPATEVGTKSKNASVAGGVSAYSSPDTTDDKSVLSGSATVIVLGAIDLLGHVIFLPIYFLALRRGQGATVGGTIPLDFAADGCVFFFQSRSFAGSQLAAVYALSDAVLLTIHTLTHFALGILADGTVVVRVLVNLVRHVVLLPLQLLAIGGAQLATIGRLHARGFTVNLSFVAFKLAGLARGQLAIRDAAGNSILLVFRPLSRFHLVVLYGGLCRIGGGSLGRRRQHERREGRAQHQHSGFVLHDIVS